MGLYLRVKFEVSSIILTGFRRGGEGGGEGDFTLNLIDCVNIRKRSEAANQRFFLLNSVKYSFSL